MQQAEIDLFLSQTSYTPQTRQVYRKYLGYFAEWWGDRSLAEITPIEFVGFLETKGWRNGLPYDHKREKFEPDAWGTSLAHNTLMAVKAFVRYSIGRKDDLGRTREIMLHKVLREEPDAQRTLTLDEIRQLEQCLDLSRPGDMRSFVMMRVSLDGRLRSSEVCGLKTHEIRFDERRIHTRRKGGKNKPAAFSPDTSIWLRAWLEERKGLAHPDCDAVFVNLDGSRKGWGIDPDHWRAICRRWGYRAGLDKSFSPHAICRAFAVIASQNGASLHQIAAGGGWSSLDMVRRYTKSLTLDDFDEFLPTRGLSESQGDSPGSLVGERDVA